MKSYQLPSELEAIGLYLHPLELKEKWGLSFEELADVTGGDLTTLKRYSFPDYAKTKRTPYRNKTILRVAKVLDELWTIKGCPFSQTQGRAA
jgi:hypothetical protein